MQKGTKHSIEARRQMALTRRKKNKNPNPVHKAKWQMKDAKYRELAKQQEKV